MDISETTLKKMAKRLKSELKKDNVIVKHTRCLEILSHIFEYKNFNEFKHGSQSFQSSENKIVLTSHEFGFICDVEVNIGKTYTSWKPNSSLNK